MGRYREQLREHDTTGRAYGVAGRLATVLPALLPAALLAILLAALVGPALGHSVAAEEASQEQPPADPPFLRGMTVSCPGYGQIWGSPSMDRSLEELADLGVEWVSIHPYAGVRRDGSIRFQPAAATGYLQRAVDIAKGRQIQLFWKPHLAYWGSFDWRGSIEFGDDTAAWRRFFDQYRDFIVDQARFAEAAGITLFSVGLEYQGTTSQEAEWRRIIAEVRRVYSGRITYAANWDHLEQIPFWDAVDWIAVQAYFPISQEDNPSREALVQGWREPLRRMEALAERYGKPVLLAEIGYDTSAEAARQPWLSQSRDTVENRHLRLRLMEVALETLESKDFISGMFWWKWIPDQRGYRDFAMQSPDVRQVLRRAWRKDDRPRVTAQ